MVSRMALAAVSILLLTGAAQTSLSPADVRVVGPASLTPETYSGRPSLRVEPGDPPGGPEDRLIVLPGGDFHDGVIELQVAGVMFRMGPDDRSGEVFYVRPTNGRAEDQERRNHATQYVSPPDWPWERLRRETPSRYEAYADMEPGKWIRLRIEVAGARARLFVNGAPQPTLIVNDLKRGADARGPVALWVGPGTIAHFADVVIDRR